MKKGQSDVIATVLIILLVLTAIIIVWNVVNSVLERSTEQIGTSALTTRLEVESAEFYVTGRAKVKLSRESGEGNITSLKFIFYDEDGESHVFEKKENMLGELETKVYEFTSDEINFRVSKVSVAPILGKNSGIVVSKEEIGRDLPSEELISWWKFEENTEDEISRNEIVKIGNPVLDSGTLKLNGVGDCLSVSVAGNLKDISEGSFTFSVWAKPAGWASSLSATPWSTLIGKTGADLFLGFRCTGNASANIYNAADVNFGLSSAKAYNLNNWHHLVLVVDDTTKNMHLFSDGAKISRTYTGALRDYSSLPVYIGCGSQWPANDNKYFNGQIDNVMIFNRALSDSEINALYNIQEK